MLVDCHLSCHVIFLVRSVADDAERSRGKLMIALLTCEGHRPLLIHSCQLSGARRIKVVAFLDLRCTNFLDEQDRHLVCFLRGPRPSSGYQFTNFVA